MSKALAFCTIGMMVMMVGSASAGEITAVQGGSVDVGTYRGVVYYTEEGKDFRVVTTIASTLDGSEPVRFVATLAENEQWVRDHRDQTIQAPHSEAPAK